MDDLARVAILLLALIGGCARQADPADSVVASHADHEDAKIDSVSEVDASIPDAAATDADESAFDNGQDGGTGGALDGEVEAGDAELEPIAPLVVVRRWDDKRFELSPEPDGTFGDEAQATAREAWCFRNKKAKHDVHPRLLEVIHSAAKHFDAPYVVVTSGYRPRRKSSYHGWGRAADIHMKGVAPRKLAEHLRTYGFVGVGVYPRTGGVHIDIRPSSYFWISYAPQGQRWQERGILYPLAKKMDREARERGLEPPEPLPSRGQAAREAKTRRRRRRAARRRRARRRRAAKRRAAKRRRSQKSGSTSR